MNGVQGSIDQLRNRLITISNRHGMGINKLRKDIGVAYRTLYCFIKGRTHPHGKSLKKMEEWVEKNF